MGFRIKPSSVSTLNSDGTGVIQGASQTPSVLTEYQRAQVAGFTGSEGQYYTKLAEWGDMPNLLNLYEASKA